MDLRYVIVRTSPVYLLLFWSPLQGDCIPRLYLFEAYGENFCSTICDEDIPTIDATTTTAPPQLQEPLTRARARQLQRQVLSFLQATPNVHENMMLPKVDVFVSLRNNGPSMDENDKLWSMYVDGDDSKSGNNGDDDATHGDYRNLKPP